MFGRRAPWICFLAWGAVSACGRFEELRDELFGTDVSEATAAGSLAQAMALCDSGEVQTAIEQLEAIAEADPTAADAFYYLGLCHLREAGEEARPGSPMSPAEEESLEAFGRALSLNPRHALAAVGVGDLYARRARGSRRGGPEDPAGLARAAYEKAVTIDPMLPDAQHHYGLFLARIGDNRKAEEALRKAAEAGATIPEKAPQYYMALGDFLARRGRLQDAIDEYELARMYRQDDPAIQRQIAVVYVRMGHEYFENEQYALAEETLAAGLDMFPDKADPEAEKASETLRELRSIRAR